MNVESVDALSLLELRAVVGQRLQEYGAFEGCTAAEQRTILAQACMVVVHLTAGEEGRWLYLNRLGYAADGTRYRAVLDVMTRLCPDVITAVRGYLAAWGMRFQQDGWHPAHRGGYTDGVNAALLEVFVTDMRQHALAAYEGNAS